ncbi:MAG: hypothetical protein OHK0039_46810 [Bacteroidia bacterium]
MKNLLRYTALLALVALVACEEVIDIELDNAAPQLVIDATLSNTQQYNRVLLSQSGGFDTLGRYPAIAGAVVSLDAASGQRYDGQEIAAGTYVFDSLQARVGETYTLRVAHGGETYEAISYLPAPLVLDSLSFVYFEERPGIAGGYLMRVHHPLPLSTSSYCRFWVTVNGRRLPDYYLYDGNQPGGTAGMFAFRMGPAITLFQPGDSIVVLAAAIDAGAYTYFSQLADLNSSSVGPLVNTATAPTNPTSNISGGVLGYFAAMGYSSIAGVVRE